MKTLKMRCLSKMYNFLQTFVIYILKVVPSFNSRFDKGLQHLSTVSEISDLSEND